jgi:hypothetical protein
VTLTYSFCSLIRSFIPTHSQPPWVTPWRPCCTRGGGEPSSFPIAYLALSGSNSAFSRVRVASHWLTYAIATSRETCGTVRRLLATHLTCTKSLKRQVCVPWSYFVMEEHGTRMSPFAHDNLFFIFILYYFLFYFIIFFHQGR